MNYIHLSLGRSQTGLYAEPGKNSFKFGSIRLNLGISISRGRSVLTYVPVQIYRSGVDPYSLMYLYKYTGQGQIRTHLCTYTNIQVKGRSVLTYVPIQIYRSGVQLYSRMYLYKYTGQGQICTHLCTCTIPVQLYRSGLDPYSLMYLQIPVQLNRSGVDPYSLLYLYSLQCAQIF